jgi:hypothetical protein
MPVGSEQLGDFFRRGLAGGLLLGERMELRRLLGGLVLVSVQVGERADQVCRVPPVVL